MRRKTSPWNDLLKVGGAAALAIAVMYIVVLAVYVPAMNDSPTPETVSEWFALYQSDLIIGLFYLGFGDIVIVILIVPLVLTLRATLAQVDKTWSAIAMPLAVVGAGVFLATNTAFTMLILSNEFVAATTEAGRSALLAAGEMTVANTHGTGGMLGLTLVFLANLIFSILMLRSELFGKVTAWIGIVSFALLVPAFIFSGYTYGYSEGIGAAMALITAVGGGLLSLVWYILTGLKLLRSDRIAA
jgi:hypothetical protein